jgi:3-oxoacyl-[acyl-carrier protein] reductase
MKLVNKVAIVTGASSGIGRASAVLFAEEGALIAAADIDEYGGQKTASDINASGGRAFFVRTDISLASEAENLVRQTIGKFGKVDILFNVAGIGQSSISTDNLEESRWDHVFAVNVKGTFLVTKSVIPAMKKGGGGVIINTGSMAAIRPRPNGLAYVGSKGALNAMTRALALELLPNKIRVNIINPAVTDTAFVGKNWPPDRIEEARKEFALSIPMGRMIRPEEIAQAALYLASDEAAMVTGICINVDGGRGL